jgi:hypothetical protein
MSNPIVAIMRLSYWKDKTMIGTCKGLWIMRLALLYKSSRRPNEWMNEWQLLLETY